MLLPTFDTRTFRSVYLNGCDVELGRDWLAFVNANSVSFCNVPRSVFGHNGVAVESSSGPVRVSTDNFLGG
jgi:hypothetical protein